MIFCTEDSGPAHFFPARILEVLRKTGIIRRSSYLFTFLGLLLTFSVSIGGTIIAFRSEPNIRVCLAENRKSLSLWIEGNYVLRYQNADIAVISGGSVSFVFSRQGTPMATLPNQVMQFYSPITIVPQDSSGILLAAADSDGITFDQQTYPGAIEIRPENNASFRVINVLPLETYLRGVVPNELINHLTPDDMQACMAQAIAARNYAFFRMSDIDSFANDPPSKGFDVYADTRDQVYSGMGGYRPLADSAVMLTSGMIVEYDGQPARCFFYSTCGGHTASVQDVWQGQPALPYLQSVSDIDSSTGEPFCIFNPNFYWSTTFSGYELNKLVRSNLAFASPIYAGKIVRGDVTSLKVLDYFPSGRVDSLEIVMDNSKTYFVRGDRTRYLFKRSDGTILKSSMFKVLVLRNYGGRITKVVLKGEGNGHGVGMCQWGALGMSRLGYSYTQILAHYYPGTVIEKAY